MRSLIALLLACVVAGCAAGPDVPQRQRSPGLAALAAINADKGMPTKAKASRISAEWDARYGELDHLDEMSDDEMADAFVSTEMVVFYANLAAQTGADRYLDHLHAIHEALVVRGVATDQQTITLFENDVTQRRIESAQRLRAKYAVLATLVVPKLRFADGFDPHAPATMSLAPDGTFDVRNESLIDPRPVFIIGCEISADAAADIAADTELMAELDAANVLWLTAAQPGVDAAVVESWNARFPRQPMRIAWSNPAWREVGTSSMPTFNYVRNGHVIDRHSGWDPAQTPARVRAALARLRTGTREESIPIQ